MTTFIFFSQHAVGTINIWLVIIVTNGLHYLCMKYEGYVWEFYSVATIAVSKLS